MNNKRKVWLALGGAAAVAVAMFAAYRRDEDPELDRAFIDGGGAATIGDTLVVRVNRAELARFVPGDPARSWGILLDGRFIEDLAPEAGSVQEIGLVATDRDGRLGREPAAADPAQAAGGRTGPASPPEAGVHRLRFRLRHTDGNKDAWADLLRGFPLVARDVTLRVGSRRDGERHGPGGRKADGPRHRRREDRLVADRHPRHAADHHDGRRQERAAARPRRRGAAGRRPVGV